VVKHLTCHYGSYAHCRGDCVAGEDKQERNKKEAVLVVERGSTTIEGYIGKTMTMIEYSSSNYIQLTIADPRLLTASTL
jgi:hypothetical protein